MPKVIELTRKSASQVDNLPLKTWKKKTNLTAFRQMKTQLISKLAVRKTKLDQFSF